MSAKHLTCWLCVIVAAGLCSCDQQGGSKVPELSPEVALAKGHWVWLLNGKNLKGWKVPEFGGSGKVYVKNGVTHMEAGDMCTGLTYVEGHADAPLKKLPREDYELDVDAMRVDGMDFFCGLTFPVGKDHISLILDGWAGAVSGLSSLDGYDASENETTQDLDFENKRWYRVRARVTKTHITCWVGDKEVVRVAREGHKIGVRFEMEDCLPLGVATYQTHGAVRNLRIRALPPTPDERRRMPNVE